jgi:hypothetical protein
MSDPQRLLSSGSEAGDLERDLLASIQSVQPPLEAKSEAWSKLSAQLAAVGLVGAAHGSAAASAAIGTPGAGVSAGAGAGTTLGWAPAAVKVLGVKWVLGVAITGAAMGGTALWVHGRATPAPTAAVHSAPVVSAASLGTAPLTEPSHQAPAKVTPAPALASTSVAAPVPALRSNRELSREDRLSAESALLTQARAELRRGDAKSAEQTLARLRSKFPNGVLGQEREVLSIEVLAARGNQDAARRRARAFITAFPKSPHSAQLSRFAEGP